MEITDMGKSKEYKIRWNLHMVSILTRHILFSLLCSVRWSKTRFIGSLKKVENATAGLGAGKCSCELMGIFLGFLLVGVQEKIVLSWQKCGVATLYDFPRRRDGIPGRINEEMKD